MGRPDFRSAITRALRTSSPASRAHRMHLAQVMEGLLGQGARLAVLLVRPRLGGSCRQREEGVVEDRDLILALVLVVQQLGLHVAAHQACDRLDLEPGIELGVREPVILGVRRRCPERGAEHDTQSRGRERPVRGVDPGRAHHRDRCLSRQPPDLGFQRRARPRADLLQELEASRTRIRMRAPARTAPPPP